MDAEGIKLRSTGAKYADGTPVPISTYRCKRRNGKSGHWCKLMTDHADRHLCVCGTKFWHEHGFPTKGAGND